MKEDWGKVGGLRVMLQRHIKSESSWGWERCRQGDGEGGGGGEEGGGRLDVTLEWQSSTVFLQEGRGVLWGLVPAAQHLTLDGGGEGRSGRGRGALYGASGVGMPIVVV